MMISRIRTGILLVLMSFMLLASAQFALAEVGRPCTSSSQCGTGETCMSSTNAQGQTARTCQRSATNMTPGGSNAGTETGGANAPGPGEALVNPLKVDSIEGLLRIVVDAVIRIGTIILVLMLIWVGFLFVTSQGNPEKVSTAKRALLWTLIGGLILLGARGISEVIQSTATNLSN